MSEPLFHPLETAAFSRRTLLSATAAVGLGGAFAIEALGAPAALASSWVQYQYPFSLDTVTNNWHETPASHSGTDFSFGGCAGAPIPAVADGVVCHKGNDANNARGLRVEIRHADGAYSAYCHMQSVSPLALNAVVSRGDTVGYIGDTGYIPDVNIGTHLHLGMSLADGQAIGGNNTFDPIPYIAARLAPSEVTDMTDMIYVALATSPEYNSGGIVVRHWSMWYQECPGAPLFPLSGGVSFSGSAMEIEYNAWRDSRSGQSAARYQASPAAIAGLIALRGVATKPINNFA